MNFGDETYMVYDKYGGTGHGFNNPITNKISIKSLFETRTDDPNTEYIVGDKAIKTFNEMFHDTPNFAIPLDIDFSVISLHMFNFAENGCKISITIVGIDINALVKYYSTRKTIPNREFICSACRFHISYETGIGDTGETSDTIVSDITKKVIVPNPDIMDPIIDHPDFIIEGKSLYDYQRRTIRWMLETEKQKKKIHYGHNYKFELEIGPFVYDIITKSLLLKEERPYVQFNGGALIDEVGLGKTIQMLTLCLLNPPLVQDMSYIDRTNNMFKSSATLVICPNQLCGQWEREIKNMITRTGLKIVLMLTKVHFDKYTYQDLLDADFVIVSYNFIGNSCFANKYLSNLTKSKSYHKSGTLWDQKNVEEELKKMSNDLITDPLNLFVTEPLFHLIYWHRIVVDEFHEAYTVNKYLFVKNIIPLLKGTYKWVVTGTPFDKGSGCFYKMFDFVTNGANTLGDNIIKIDEIKNHMKDDFFKRNTKQSVEDEVKLPELREKIIWLKFTHTERMMYNAYLTDPNISRFSEIVRQICCHPKIADEIKGVLSKCKTLSEIEKSMVSHYRKQYISAEKHVVRCKRLIAKTERRMLIVEYKRQRKFLKKCNYRVKIDLPAFKFDDKVEEDTEDLESDDEVNNQVDMLNDEDNDNGLNLEYSDDDNDDEEELPLMVVNQANQQNIMKIIKRMLDAEPSMTYANLREILRQQRERLVEATNIYDGKKASYNFFKNMMDRIKKFTDKSKAKYEKIMASARRRDEEGSDYESSESEDEEDENDNCGICLCEISGEDVGVTKCGHIFCYACLKTVVNDNQKCPVCQTPQKLADISMISFEKPVYTKENTQLIKNKLELIDQVGTKLTNLIYYLNSIPDHVIIFSQWDSLLKKVGDVLTEHGIKNVFCRGNVWSRDKAIREFNSDDKIKVIMLSSESAASGTNLTKASKVILLDPVSGTYEYRRNMEWQGIGRAYRLGQKKSVEIVRLIVKDTVEEEIYKENKVEDAKQKTQMVISEITDDIITLTDDKLQSIAEASIKAKELKEQKKKERDERLAKLKEAKTVVKKGTTKDTKRVKATKVAH